jgi:predicted small metal-binding protein
MKILRCRDAGADCDFEARATTEEEIMRLAAEHGRADHGMDEIPDDMKTRLRSLIREE